MGLFTFDKSVDIETQSHICKYIEEANEESRRQLLFFITGSYSLPMFRKITVKGAASDGVFASTCLFEWTIPKAAKKYEDLCSLINSTITQGGGRSFTAV